MLYLQATRAEDAPVRGFAGTVAPGSTAPCVNTGQARRQIAPHSRTEPSTLVPHTAQHARSIGSTLDTREQYT
eukprot:452421-Rhodomonas_salina.2